MESMSNNYGIPDQFYEEIKPYVDSDSRTQITGRGELFALWNNALAAATNSPEAKEQIAEWTVAAAAASDLLSDPDLEAVHHTFASLEDKPLDADEEEIKEQWNHLTRLVSEISNKK